jgi:hypothetical protein
LRGVSKDGYRPHGSPGEAQHRPETARSLSSGAHSRDPLAPPHHEDASNDGCYVRSNNCRINVVILPFGDIISFMMVK